MSVNSRRAFSRASDDRKVSCEAAGGSSAGVDRGGCCGTTVGAGGATLAARFCGLKSELVNPMFSSKFT